MPKAVLNLLKSNFIYIWNKNQFYYLKLFIKNYEQWEESQFLLLLILIPNPEYCDIYIANTDKK